MDEKAIALHLNSDYCCHAHTVELYRDGGNQSYTVYGDRKYFLKVIRKPFLETAMSSLDIQLYLLQNRFPVIPIIRTRTGAPCVRVEERDAAHIFILYLFTEGTEPAPEDAEEVGGLIGRLHRIMRDYPGGLPERDKHFFIDRYIQILQKQRCSQWEAFRDYGDEVWEKVKNLPRGYCHGDLYVGNIHKTADGTLYVVDFDTSCIAFPLYDIALFCNGTNYFEFDGGGYERTQARLRSFLKGYLPYSPLSAQEIAAVYDLLAVYHFQLQATILEVYGYDCVDAAFFDRQYEWLLRWKAQCAEKRIDYLQEPTGRESIVCP